MTSTHRRHLLQLAALSTAAADNAQEADWGLPTMMIVERSQTRLAVLDLAVSV
jgi:hypothetical protein